MRGTDPRVPEVNLCSPPGDTDPAAPPTCFGRHLPLPAAAPPCKGEARSCPAGNTRIIVRGPEASNARCLSLGLREMLRRFVLLLFQVIERMRPRPRGVQCILWLFRRRKEFCQCSRWRVMNSGEARRLGPAGDGGGVLEGSMVTALGKV